MIDWTKSMTQTYEFMVVDPYTLNDIKRLDNVLSCSIERDSENDTLGSASFEVEEFFGECYVRVYLVAKQDSLTHREALGTFLIQSGSDSFNGKRHVRPLDGYSPLVELREKYPPLGYSLPKYVEPQNEGDIDPNNIDIVVKANELLSEHLRVPVTVQKSSSTDSINRRLYSNFVAERDDTWLTFIRDLLDRANYAPIIDPYGRVSTGERTNVDSMASVYTFNDDNSSILLADVDDSFDYYSVPNSVEVIFEASDGSVLIGTAKNELKSSPVSIPNRGREVYYRESDPSLTGQPDQDALNAYAENLLKSLSKIQHTITFSHAYYPVKLGDCVTINYLRAGIINVRAKIIAQSIDCVTGCTISETAVYTTNLME